MTEPASWPAIAKRGLMSTAALVDEFRVPLDQRLALLSARRPKSVVLTHPCTGETATVRDNGPLREDILARVLTDMAPRDWYEELNRRVFFWVSEEKLNNLLVARRYRTRAHEVICVDTRELVARHGPRVNLSPINTGAAFAPSAAPRGSGTFQSIEDYPLDEMVRRRGKKNAIVELTVTWSVPDIQRMTLRVERRCGLETEAVLWSAGA